MKRLLAGLVVLVMMGMCASSFGFFLIYNVSTTVKGGDSATDAKAAVPLKAYLVLDLNDSNGLLVDANLIMYGNDANTPKKQKVYVQLNHSDDADLLGADVWYIDNLIFVDFWGRSPFDFEIMLQGKTALKDVGFGTSDKMWVASSIKGDTMVWDNFLLGPSASQSVSGTANASASLWTAATKYVNAHGWTQEQIIEVGSPDHESLIQILEDFVPATLPTP
ncbi:MAG: hypothetical protein ABSG97_08530 [Sedimentisphaerales bacterium]|jgi:hypothetical protein